MAYNKKLDMIEKKLIESTTKAKGLKSDNWPPSRGPKPKWLEKPKIVFENFKIEMLAQHSQLPPRIRPSAKKKSGIKDIILNHSVENMATISPEHWLLISGVGPGEPAILLTHLQATELTVELSYPMNVVARVTIKPYRTYRTVDSEKRQSIPFMNIGYVLWQLSRAYKKIYQQHKKYGVWGHALSDLYYERLTIVGTAGYVEIGS